MSIPNVNGSFVNTDNSHGTSYTFTDTTISHVKPPCLNYLSGGKKKRKRYIMASKRKTRKNKSKKNRSRKHRKHRTRGGYSQYQNNQPYYKPFSIGSETKINSALANPSPYYFTRENTALQNLDNYNHYTNRGSVSKGWF